MRERAVGLGVCVLCCEIVLPQAAAQRGASERQKSTLYIEKYINLRSIITTNTRDKH